MTKPRGPLAGAVLVVAIVVAGVTARPAVHEAMVRWRMNRVYGHMVGEDRPNGEVGTNEILYDWIPLCARHAPDPDCMDELTRAFGGDRFRGAAPDAASAAAMAIRVKRDDWAERVPEGDAWVDLLRDGTGDGVDVARLAIGWHVSYESGGCALEHESCAQEEMMTASRTPGTCAAYARMRYATVDAQLHDDERACVNADRQRAGAPVESERDFAATAMAARWRNRTTLAALRAGIAKTASRGRAELTHDVTYGEQAPQRGF